MEKGHGGGGKPPPSTEKSSHSRRSSTSKLRRIGDYEGCVRIGSGSFASVWKGFHKDDHHVVAIKSFKRENFVNDPKKKDHLEMEISTMKKMKHPNIVNLFETHHTQRHIYLIMELCEGDDLAKFIQRHGAMTEPIAKHFLKQLALGLEYLRAHNIVHRDLKPQNLLLKENSPTSVLKIADFGFARYMTQTSMAATLCGSPLYMAPEILGHERYTAKADLWSVGTILYEMMVGKPPFTAVNAVHLHKVLMKTDVSFPHGVEISDECKDLILRLLKRKANERIDYDEFFAHPFVNVKKEVDLSRTQLLQEAARETPSSNASSNVSSNSSSNSSNP